MYGTYKSAAVGAGRWCSLASVARFPGIITCPTKPECWPLTFATTSQANKVIVSRAPPPWIGDCPRHLSSTGLASRSCPGTRSSLSGPTSHTTSSPLPRMSMSGGSPSPTRDIYLSIPKSTSIHYNEMTSKVLMAAPVMLTVHVGLQKRLN